MIRNEVKHYLKELRCLDVELKENLVRAPEGFIRTTGSADSKMFYWVHNQNGHTKNQYIKKGETELVTRLLQKSYDQKMQSAVEKRIISLTDCLQSLDSNLDDIYTNLSEIKKRHIIPYRLSDELFIEQWCKAKFTGKQGFKDNLKHTTKKGEIVRSKSERSIADLLYSYQIPYRYEAPLELKSMGIVYPDFTILDIRTRKPVYWEHFGKMDDPDYVQKAINKLNTYILNGYHLGKDLLITMESQVCPLDQPEICQMIETHLLGDQ